MCHVLIIEDESLIALDLQMLLEEEGATSFAIAGGEQEAIASAMETRPDVITSDVKINDGSGPHAVQAIHERLGLIPVIFITSSPEECEPCEPPGVVLGKPFDARAVAKAFHTLQV
jgi:CheY-like chemotaxis protein